VPQPGNSLTKAV